MPRGGHFISNGRYQNQAPPMQQFHQQRPQTTNNIIGNTAENTFLTSRFQDSAVNSIVNASPGSSNNVIGNRAYNTFGGGTVNSIVGTNK